MKKQMDIAIIVIIVAVTVALAWWTWGALTHPVEEAVLPAVQPSAATTPAPTVQPTTTATAATAAGSFSSLLTELHILQQDPRGAQTPIVFYDNRPYPKQPETFALHLSEVYMFISLKDTPEAKHEELLRQISFSDGVKTAVAPTRTNDSGVKRYKIDVSGIRDRFSVTFGDLAPITFERRQPITFTAEGATGAAADRLLLHAREFGNRLYVPDNEQTVTLVFSEPMNRATAAALNGAEWLDDRRLRVALKPGVERTQVPLASLFSHTGNYMAEWERSLTVYRVTDRFWTDAPAKAPVGWGPRMRYYDHVLPAPDGSRFIGAVYLDGPMADEGGEYYGLVLEEKGKLPIVVEDIYHSEVFGEPDGVTWIDRDRLLTFSYLEATVRNFATGGVNSFKPAAGTSINRAVYDRFAAEMHLLLQRATPEKGEEAYAIDLETYRLDQPEKPARTVKSFTEAVFEMKYNLLSMPVRFTEKGSYWTKAEKGRIKTVYAGRDGKEHTADGLMIGADKNGVFLRQWLQPDEAGYGELPKLFYWTPGAGPQPLPASPSWPQAFADGLLAEVEDGGKSIAYLLDADSNQWKPAPWSGPGVKTPVQHETSFYRVEPNTRKEG